MICNFCWECAEPIPSGQTMCTRCRIGMEEDNIFNREFLAKHYEIVEASPIEWGLIYIDQDGGRHGCRTWWKGTLGENPTLEHPEVAKAIENNEEFIRDNPNYFKETK